MRRRLPLLGAIGALLGAAWLIYTYLLPVTASHDPAAAPQPRATAAPPPRAAKPLPVHTLTVQRGTIRSQITATGDILAAARVEVFPNRDGQLQELHVEEGDHVRAGQELARLADAELRARQAQAVAVVDALRAEWAEMQAGAMPEEIAQAEARVQHAAAEKANADGVLTRARAMVDRGLQSAQELDDATRRVTQAQAAHNSALKQLQLLRAGARVEARQALQARLRAAQAAQRLVAAELEDTVVTAPMDGIVSHRHIDPGTFVTTTKVPIVTLVAMDSVRIKVPISERDISRVHQGLTARIQVDAYPEEVFTGTIHRVSPIVDPVSRSGEVEIAIPNTDLRLKPGMFAKVDLLLDEHQDVVVIPRGALRRDGTATVVFIVQNGVAQRRPVSLGLQNDTMVEIVDGLAPDSVLVVSGQQGLKDKSAVLIVQSKE